jgi:hypothetical protein
VDPFRIPGQTSLQADPHPLSLGNKLFLEGFEAVTAIPVTGHPLPPDAELRAFLLQFVIGMGTDMAINAIDAALSRELAAEAVTDVGGAANEAFQPVAEFCPADLAGATQTTEGEIASLPEFAKMTREEIIAELESRRYHVTYASGSGTGEPGYVWTKEMPDGRTAVVRVDPVGQRRQANGRSVPRDWAAYNPHAHKETVDSSAVTDGNYGPEDSSIVRFDDTGRIPRLEDFNSRDEYSRAIHIPLY